MVTMLVPQGTVAYTPAQQLAHKKWLERQAEISSKKEELLKLGSFCFINSEECFSDLSNNVVTKLMRLCTHSDYNNRLMRTKKTPLLRGHLQRELNITSVSVSKFLKCIETKYLEYHDDGYMYINKEILVRGTISLNSDTHYRRIYFKGMKSLYNGISKKNHAAVGKVFKLLRYINIKYNILCHPDYVLETEIDNIRPLSVKEFSELTSSNKGHVDRINTVYNDMTFYYNGAREHFLKIIKDPVYPSSEFIYINPHVIYGGDDPIVLNNLEKLMLQ